MEAGWFAIVSTWNGFHQYPFEHSRLLGSIC